MKKRLQAWSAVGGMMLLACGAAGVFAPLPAPAAETADEGLAPVETNMHEFMEYAFQPAYKRLKAAMNEGEDAKRFWSRVKAESLVLAEGGNLLLIRGPEEHRDQWEANALQVRDLAAKLYHAGHEKDFAAAKESYQQMLKACNTCHKQFAHGEHQLTP
jgi:hypothetical protein